MILKIFKTIFLLGTVLAAEIYAQEPILYTSFDHHSPKIAMESTRYLGDRMMVQRYGHYEECFTTKTHLKIGWKGENYEFIPNEFLCKGKKDDLYYYPKYTLSVNCRGKENVGTCPLFTGQAKPVDIIEHENNYELRISHPRAFGKGYKFHKKFRLSDVDKQHINFQPVFFYANGSSQRTIDYAGKSGTTLTFIYSEFQNDYIRPAFTREFKVDLAAGNIGAYKGAIFEVIEATNATIKYKVIRHFQ